MSDVNVYDPSELISVCGAIIGDGELSGDEIYGLAEWLNNHREACFHWPGNLLVQPLQDVWVDGKINKTELRTISRVLLRIRKEWSKLQKQEAAERMKEFIATTALNIDPRYAQLPSIPVVLQIKSHSEKGLKYQVDLSEPSCTCPDWLGGRRNISVGNLTRCCKHILDAFSQIEPDCGWPSWLGAFFSSGWPPHPHQKWSVLSLGRSYALISSPVNGWANVFVKGDESYDRFGYNVEERRWSYGIAPPGCRAIAKILDN